ncbi:MMPL family transporter [Streptomyces luomodiensis]|uniref:MMPL family transporter n=1 Tax=Streptomyces luomodiensis TaxID=3026192 RepID=A0ABY9VFY2_9ACTN|nr:MMPL family transporter [Streptomyces sp. SCA4-21]WNF00870.1 MMPL family transporter [Streptomyces sp. SCA4-21]
MTVCIIGAPRRTLAATFLLLAVAAVVAVPVMGKLSAGGFRDPGAESSRATTALADTFDQGKMQLLLTVTAPGGVAGSAARTAGSRIVEELEQSPHVASVSSPWTAPGPAAATLTSKDGDTGLIAAGLYGEENDAQRYARDLADKVTGTADGVVVKAGGGAMLYSQIRERSEADLSFMEAVATPLSLLALIWVFGGLVAAGLPLAVAVVAIACAAAALRLLTMVTEISVFALSLATALGLALAIDYTLLIISRFRDELARRESIEHAVVRTMSTAGRTVLFSASTVILCTLPMLLFPMSFLRSMAYAAMLVVAFAAAGALVITPAAMTLLGHRIESWNLKTPVRRLFGRSGHPVRRTEDTFWYRSTKAVMRRPLVTAVAVTAALLLLGSPFLGVRYGFPDDRVLSSSASVREVGDQLREDFTVNPQAAVSVVLKDTRDMTPTQLGAYAAALSRVPGVTFVAAPGATFVDGERSAGQSAGAGAEGNAAFLTVASAAPVFSAQSEKQLDGLHAVPVPGDAQVMFTGTAQVNRDSVDAVTSRLPLVILLITIVALVLLFAVTGSVLLPLKAVVLDMISLSAAFGALVWIFQDGHLGALGTTSVGTLVIQTPIVLFFIAFGVSMDYEVFIMSRIKEYWKNSDRTDEANAEAVARGLARTGPVVTAAAAIMTISFAALIAAQVSNMRMLGFGLMVVVLVDATLVRMLLVPAFMKMLGRANWWAPRRLRAWHDRWAISDDGAVAPVRTEVPVG